ncbi:glycosyltransferase family 4 protein [Pirellulaceae bacterium SH501]
MGARRGTCLLTVLDCGFIHRTTGIRRLLLRFAWLKVPVSYARCVTTISNAAKNDIIRFSGCHPAKIHVIPVAISEDFQFAIRSFNSQCPRFLHIGSAPNKNLERHILALDGKRCHLNIIGSVSAHCLELLTRSGLSYQLYNNLDACAVRAVFSQSDALLFASTHEGFGMPILEAQATGIPVITSNCSSMPEVAGVGALLCDPFSVSSISDAVDRLVRSEELRRQLISKGLENAKRFDPQKIAESYANLYRTIWGV